MRDLVPEPPWAPEQRKKEDKHNAIFWLQIVEPKSAIFFLCVTYGIYIF